MWKHTFNVNAETCSASDLESKIEELNILASDNASSPSESLAESIMYLSADILLTLRHEKAKKWLAGRANGV